MCIILINNSQRLETNNNRKYSYHTFESTHHSRYTHTENKKCNKPCKSLLRAFSTKYVATYLLTNVVPPVTRIFTFSFPYLFVMLFCNSVAVRTYLLLFPLIVESLRLLSEFHRFPNGIFLLLTQKVFQLQNLSGLIVEYK